MKLIKMEFCQICNEFMRKSDVIENDTSSLCDDHVTDLCKHVVNITNGLKKSENREMISYEVIARMCSCFRTGLNQTHTLLHASRPHEGAPLYSTIQLTTELSRCLRNACAGCHSNQDQVASDPELIPVLCHSMDVCCRYVTDNPTSELDSQVHVLLRCCVQFLGNFSAANTDNGKTVWKHFFDHFSCSLADPVTLLHHMVETPTGQQLLCVILEFMTQGESEWGLYIIEWVLTHPELLNNIWTSLSEPTRNLLLDIMLTQLNKSHDQVSANQQKEQVKSNDITVPIETVGFVCIEFKDKAHIILGLHKGQELNAEIAVLVTKQLEILCSVTTESDIYKDTCNDRDLLKVAINLLHCMQLLGQEGENMFSNLSKLSSIEGQNDTDSPITGLKCDLIRLIANMVHSNKPNQDMVREMGGINLIMDHTNIDGRNPFITQWSIFAIHNLLEGNHDNQALVAAMRLEGLSNNVDQLREFGVEAELVGEQIRIMSVNSDQGTLPFSKPRDKHR